MQMTYWEERIPLNEIVFSHTAVMQQIIIKNRYVGAGNKDSHNMPCNMVILPLLKRL